MAKPIISAEVKRTNFDSEFCGSIPLNFINLVQNHGCLLVLDKSTLNIVQTSSNCRELLNKDVDQILNKNISGILSEGYIKEIKRRLDEINLYEQVPLGIEIQEGEQKRLLTCTIHNKEHYTLIEIEKERPIEGNKTFTYLHQNIKFIMVKIKDARSIEELCQTASEELKKLSLFDRVMIYKFDEDWNGTVIAEAKEDELEPYLHLRFPASDIPKSARDLYLRNPFRLIPDRNAKPSKLLPLMNPLVQGFTDLSDCNLRSVPAVHLEYLKNMDVTASMSTPIIKEGKLWGLISCHHREAKFPSYEMLSCFELLSGIISSQIISKENEVFLGNKNNLLNINGKILERIYKEDSLTKSLFEGSPDILQLLNISGAAIIYEKTISTKGETPEQREIQQIVNWLERRNTTRLFYTDNLPKIYTDTDLKNFAGLIVITIDPNKQHYVLGFRPEIVFTVDWGGNPYEAINIETDGKTYHPRNSFSKWKEIVKNTSAPWLNEEIEAADVLRSNILEKLVISK